MDRVRYYLALAVLISWLPAFGFWRVIHPFVRFWRRLGAGRTYAIVLSGCALAGYAAYRLRVPLLRVEFGTHYLLIALGAVCYALSVWIDLQRRKQLTWRTLVGLPELKAGKEGPGKLLTEGIYRRVRHPRYLASVLALAMCALVSNYLAIYVLLVAFVPVIYVVARLEERELLDRFGAAYESYRRTTPMFIPRILT
jgi:protein-S-isoprenylcysteine O-methyltransferase Ste14